jgi:hypothetical protein
MLSSTPARKDDSLSRVDYRQTGSELPLLFFGAALIAFITLITTWL